MAELALRDLPARCEELTRRFVAVRSVNGEPAGERRAADFLEHTLREIPYFAAHPACVLRQELPDDPLHRANVFAWLTGTKREDARTNQRGFEEVRDGLAPYGYEVIPVPGKEEYLHLDMCFNLVDDHLAVAYRDGMPEDFLARLKQMEIDIIPVEEEAIFVHGCNLQALGNHRVLSLAQNKRVNEELRRRGMEVIELPITEILKAGGGPHCMTFPLARG